MRFHFFIKRLARCLIIAGMILFFFFETGCHSPENKQAVQEVPDSVFHSERYAQLTDSISRFPDSAKYYFERGALSFVTKDFKNAKKDFNKAFDLNPFMSAYATALGQLYLSQEFPDSAIYYFQEALKIDSINLRARLQLAYIFLQKKKYHKTLKQTDTLLMQDDQLTQAMGLQSQAYQALGDTAKALQVMRKVISLPPVSYDALMRMGDLLLAGGNKEALKYYEQAAEKDTTAGEPYYCIGLYYEKQDIPDKAIAAYNRSIVREVGFVKAYMRLGQLYEKAGNWEKAKEIFNLAIKISPADAMAYYHRGLANERLNNITAAVIDYKQALVFDENSEKAKTALRRIKKQ